ncbi:unnamed protein product [Phytomonas sp. EM1]|nr:unnamed protein product [Phytomonas sp. EM1]|eukprot:CCW64038.1 unnamed protein product [Phytomonas sp. isolate EM1]
MEYLADKCLENGDLTGATDLFASLEKTNPKYSKMARICRVLSNPTSVPLPYRHSDICEALLDPSITSRVLLRGTPSVESIRKYYQQLIVHVHPDKNPTPSAKEAFLRLVALQKDALQYFDQKQKEAASLIPNKPSASARGRNKVKGTRGGAVASRLAEDMPNIFHAKKNRITLKSLKRKDIADDFEIFSSPRNRFNPQAGDIDEDQLHSVNRNMQTRTKTNPPVRGRSKAKNRRWPNHANGIEPTMLDSFSPVSDSTSQHEAGFDVPEEEFSSDSDGRDLSAVEIEPVNSTQMHPMSNSNEVCTEEDFASRQTFSHNDCDYSQIRDQIDVIIEALNNMRFHNPPVRLECDLSFAAYERIKNQARLA